jgi:hypothetical protein
MKIFPFSELFVLLGGGSGAKISDKFVNINSGKFIR